MNKIGRITNISSSKARVVFEDLGTVSYELKIAKHIDISTLSINDKVLVAFINENDLRTGIIIAEI